MEDVLLLQVCDVRNNSEMICPLPYFPNITYFPNSLIQANSSFSEDGSAVRGPRRRRATATEDVGGGWQLLGRLWNLLRTGSWHSEGNSPPHRLSRQKRAPVASVKSENASLRLYLGFVMDKLTSLRNISKTKPNLQLELIPFDFRCDSTNVDFDPAVNPLLKIKVISCIFPITVVFVLISSYSTMSTCTPNYPISSCSQSAIKPNSSSDGIQAWIL